MQALKNHITHINFLIDQGGVGKIIDHVKENVLFDMKYGTNTSTWLEKRDFKDHPNNFIHGVRYRAAATNEIKNALEKVSKLIDTSKAGYYDLGCGKGKTLCIAGLNYSYNQIVGVDYYKPFLNQARKNIIKCGLNNIDLRECDMAEFTCFKDTSVVFLYNPASEMIINKVRHNLEAYTEKAIVIYNKPKHSDIFKNWDKISTKKNNDPDHNTSIYSFGF